MTEKKGMRLGQILFYVPTLLIVGMMFVEVLNVFGRMSKLQLSGSGEVTAFASAIFISFCIFLAILKDANVYIGFIVELLPNERLKALFLTVSNGFSLITVVLLAWAGLKYANQMAISGERSLLLNIPVAPVRYLFVLGLLLSIAILIMKFFRATADVMRK
jgi:TRAP-type C4-dicarboxylate transport system permease small subunit